MASASGSAGLARVANGLGRVADRAGGQIVMGELDDVGGARGGDVLERGRDPGVQPGPFHPAGARIQALVDERMPEPESPAALGRGDQARGNRRLEVEQ